MYKIGLDAGHDTNTPGKRTPIFPDGTSMKENEFNERVVAILEEELTRCGFNTLIVAPEMGYVPLSVRVDRANKAKIDLYISIHANANNGEWGNWTGIETYHYPKAQKGKKYAEILQKHLIQATNLRNRGVKTANFYVLKYTNMPAILSENGFMDSLSDASKLRTEAFRQVVAVAHAKAVCEMFGVPYRFAIEEEVETEAVPQYTEADFDEAIKVFTWARDYLYKGGKNL